MAEIPDKKEYVIKVQLSGWQEIVYDQLAKKGVLTMTDSQGKRSQKSLMNLMMQLRKICNHPYLFLQ